MKITIDVDKKVLVFLIGRVAPATCLMCGLAQLNFGRIIDEEWVWHTGILEETSEKHLFELYQQITKKEL